MLPAQSAALRRAWTMLVWLGVAAFVAQRIYATIKNQPHARGWSDATVYLSTASDYISHPGSIYDAALRQINHLNAGPRYIYPPSGLIPFLPLVPVVRGFGLATAASIWSGIDALAVIVAIAVIGRKLKLSWATLGLVALLVAISGPFGLEGRSGQVNGVVLLMLGLSWRARSDGARGALLGVALALKPVAVLLLVIPLLRGRPRVPAIALGTVVVLSLPFALFSGAHEMTSYLTQVFPHVAGFDTVDANNLSLASVLDVWIGGRALDAPNHAGVVSALHVSWAATGLLWAVRIAVVAALVRAARRSWVDDMVLVAAVTATVPLFGAMSWPHYEIYFIPLLLVGLGLGSRRVRALSWVAGVLLLFDGLSNGIYYVHFPMHSRDWLLLVQGEAATVAAVVAVLVVLLRCARPRGRPPVVERDVRGSPVAKEALRDAVRVSA